MINPFKDINWNPSAPETRKFGWSLVIGFPILAAVLYLARWWFKGAPPEPAPHVWLGAGGVAVGLFALVLPGAARPFYWLWYGFAACIGLVMSNLLLSIVYYALFTPIGLFRRWRGHDPLQLRQPRADSYWRESPPPAKAADYFTQS